MKDHIQTIINVCLAVSITFLIYQNTQLNERLSTLDLATLEMSIENDIKLANLKSELQDCIDIGYKGVPKDERAWIETHERLFNQCTNYLSK